MKGPPNRRIHCISRNFLTGPKSSYPKLKTFLANVCCVLNKSSSWTKKERIRHYDAIHISKLIVVGEKTCLYCKCSAVRSRGSDDMTRNSHYHCPVCHWPQDAQKQIGQHIYTKHKSVALGDYSHLMH